MAITPLPTPPTRDDPSTFSSRADAFLGALPTFVTEANALVTDVNTDAADALASAQAAVAAQVAAEAVQVFVESVANIDVFVGGFAYEFGDVCYSPTSLQSYRRRLAGSSFLDPASDPTNWAQLTALPDQTGNAGKFVTTDGTNASWAVLPPLPYLLAVDQKAQGTASGTLSNGENQRTLNTVLFNTISGASVASDEVTLPAGTYLCKAVAASSAANTMRLLLRNQTDATTTLIGIPSDGPYSHSVPPLSGKFTIASSKSFRLIHWCASASGASRGSAANVSGLAEVYSSVEFWKVA